MNESLAAACGQFEQVMLGEMLRSAEFVRSRSHDVDEDADPPFGSADTNDAFAQLLTQALAAAVERAGGIGLRARLASALGGRS